MVPAAHLPGLLTKGGFRGRGQTPSLVYGLQWESWRMRQQEAIGELVWSHAAYQIKLHSMPARLLHNWHTWRGKKHKKTWGGWWYTCDDRWVLSHFYSKSLTKLDLLENKYNATKLQLFKLFAEQKRLLPSTQTGPFFCKNSLCSIWISANVNCLFNSLTKKALTNVTCLWTVHMEVRLKKRWTFFISLEALKIFAELRKVTCVSSQSYLWSEFWTIVYFTAKFPKLEMAGKQWGPSVFLSINGIKMYNVREGKLKWWKQTSLTVP